MSPFRRSLPVTLTSFINKSGQIGLSIIPILLVERQISTNQSAWIMGAINAAGLVGILVGGLLCDRLGLRKTLLLSFLVAGIGMAPLPFFHKALLLALFGCLAQLGTSLYYASARLLITQLVRPHERREAIAWQRTSNNLAQIISFSLGAVLGRFGATPLILFDAATSLVAAAVGSKIVPEAPQPVAPQIHIDSQPQPPAQLVAPQVSKKEFLQCAAIIAAFSFLYELYIVGAAAECRVLFGVDGLSVFSKIMVINTVLCAALSVVATKFFKNTNRVLPAGMLLMITGLTLTFNGSHSRAIFYLGSLILTLGEIVFNSLAGLVQIHIAPPGKRQASAYSAGIFIQFIGRISGGALAFPLLIGSSTPLTWIAATSIPALALTLASRRALARVET